MSQYQPDPSHILSKIRTRLSGLDLSPLMPLSPPPIAVAHHYSLLLLPIDPGYGPLVMTIGGGDGW